MLGNLFQVLENATTAALTNEGAFCDSTGRIWWIIGTVIKIIQIAIPILIVFLGTLDLGKAVMAGDDKQIKEAQGAFLKRIVYGVAVFFVILLVRAVFGIVGEGNAVGSHCFECAAHSTDASKCGVN